MTESRRSLGGGQSFGDRPASGRVGKVIALDAGGLGVSRKAFGRFEQSTPPDWYLRRNDPLAPDSDAPPLTIYGDPDDTGRWLLVLNARWGFADSCREMRNFEPWSIYLGVDEETVQSVRRCMPNRNLVIGDGPPPTLAEDGSVSMSPQGRVVLADPAVVRGIAAADYACPLCFTRFPHPDVLARHIRAVHPDAPPLPEPEPEPEPEPPAPDLTPDEVREVYEEDPYVSERETPPWIRD